MATRDANYIIYTTYIKSDTTKALTTHNKGTVHVDTTHKKGTPCTHYTQQRYSLCTHHTQQRHYSQQDTHRVYQGVVTDFNLEHGSSKHMSRVVSFDLEFVINLRRAELLGSLISSLNGSAGNTL